MFGKKSEKQIYNQGLEKGKALQESEDIRKFSIKEENIKNYHEEKIDELTFDIMRLQQEVKTLKAENKRLTDDNVQVKITESMVKREWNRIDIFKAGMIDSIDKAKDNAMLPFQNLMKMIEQAPEKDKQLEESK